MLRGEAKNALKHSERQFGEIVGFVALFAIVRILVENGHISQANAQDNMRQITALHNWKRELKKRRTSISANDFRKSRDLINPVWLDKCWASARIDVGGHPIEPSHEEWLLNCKTDLGTGLAFADITYTDLRGRRIKTSDRNNLMWVLCILEDGFGKGSKWFTRSSLSGQDFTCP